MLDQYDGYLTCRVNNNNGQFAECDIVGARSMNPAASIDDEFWLGPDMIQVHAERLGLTAETFRGSYPVGKEFLVEFRVRVLEGTATVATPLTPSDGERPHGDWEYPHQA